MDNRCPELFGCSVISSSLLQTRQRARALTAVQSFYLTTPGVRTYYATRNGAELLVDAVHGACFTCMRLPGAGVQGLLGTVLQISPCISSTKLKSGAVPYKPLVVIFVVYFFYIQLHKAKFVVKEKDEQAGWILQEIALSYGQIVRFHVLLQFYTL